jgi:hypothetical protein
MQSRKLLVLLGPQGSGNHMFSKLFALHPDVFGWQALTERYWLRHEFEPFNQAWKDPEHWPDTQINQTFAVTSCSVPCVVNRQHHLPDVTGFLESAEANGWEPTVAVIGRDINILLHQQRRVRREITLPNFIQQLDNIMIKWPVTFISHELAVLYRSRYLRELSERLEFPVAWDDPRVEEILAVNANANYVQPAPAQPADKLVWG